MKRLYKTLLSILSGLLLSAAWPERGFPVLLFFAFVPLFCGLIRAMEKPRQQSFVRFFALCGINCFDMGAAYHLVGV